MDFESFLKSENADGKIDFSLRAELTTDGHVQFYIHPDGKDGGTEDYKVIGNQLECISQPFDPLAVLRARVEELENRLKNVESVAHEQGVLATSEELRRRARRATGGPLCSDPDKFC